MIKLALKRQRVVIEMLAILSPHTAAARLLVPVGSKVTLAPTWPPITNY